MFQSEQGSSSSNAPLELHLTTEIEPVHLDLDALAADRNSLQNGIDDSNPPNGLERRSGESRVGDIKGSQLNPRVGMPSFRVEHEMARINLCNASRSLLEPVGYLLEVLTCDGQTVSPDVLRSIPSFLDFFPEQLIPTLQDVSRVVEVAEPVQDDLGSDAAYRGKKSENVDAITLETPSIELVSGAVQPSGSDEVFNPSRSGPSTNTGGPQAIPPHALVKTTQDGISVAHSVIAYDLSGSMPWSNYSTDAFLPLSPADIRYHRVHLVSPNLDRGPRAWPVHGPKPASPLEAPRDGSCSFRNSLQLSLRDDRDFVLFESVEQYPLLMHFHGMSGAMLRYWRPKHGMEGSSSPDQTQMEALGQFGHAVKLETEFLPRAFGGNTIKVDSTCTVFESSLIRAPLFTHSTNPTDFLLVRSRAATGRSQSAAQDPFHCVLREIKHVYTIGQAEPLLRVDVPVVPRLHQTLAARVMLECRRFWLKAKQQPNLDFVNRMFIGERKSLLNRYFSEALKEISQRPSLGLVASITPEEACVVNSMKEGIRRLAERGVERICAISPMRIRNYVRDIEMFERSMPAASRTPRIAHFCVQLENEMRLSPWNLTNDYWDVLTGKRGAMFQFSPLGDPSGGRGEGISFRKILRTESVSAAAVLGSVTGSASIEIEEIRARSKNDLISELKKLNVPERVWKTMSRWQLMRQLALLLGIEDDSEERLAPWKRKALHTEKIFEAFKKQTKALCDTDRPAVTADEQLKAAEAFAELGVTVVAGQVSPSAVQTPEADNTDTDDDEEARGKGKNLEEMMLDDLLMPDEPGDGPDSAVVAKPQITRLQIVSVGRAKSTGHPWSQVTYVYGERNIALYRKWKELEEEGETAASRSTPVSPGDQLPLDWQQKVEMTLKVHRRFQRIIKQAAEAGRPIPDCKRCGACHLFGHDQSYEGCPMLLRDLDVGPSPGTASQAKRKRDVQQSPIYD